MAVIAHQHKGVDPALQGSHNDVKARVLIALPRFLSKTPHPLRMNPRLKCFLVCVLLIVVVGSCWWFFVCRGPDTVVMVLRHAEKVDETANSGLTDAGTERAETFAHVARKAGVQAIFHTQFPRTRLTVGPLANALGITTEEYQKDDVAGVVSRVRSDHRGQTVVVAGHSDTVPALVDGFLGRAANVSIGAGDFDNLFVVVRPRCGRARLVHLQYGAPTAP